MPIPIQSLATRTELFHILPGIPVTLSPDSTVGVSGMQILLMSDQVCTLYIDQSVDQVNWTVTNVFHAPTGANAWTIPALAYWIRIRMENYGTIPASVQLQMTLDSSTFRTFRLMCPVCQAFVVDLLKHSLECDDNDHTIVAVHVS